MCKPAWKFEPQTAKIYEDMTFLRKFTFYEETIHLNLLIQCNESNCECIHAFVLNIKNCKFKTANGKNKAH